WRSLSVVAILLLLSACGAREVVVQGNFPKPLMDPLPLTLGVIYTDEFAQHEIFDEAAGRAESDWLVKTGDAQVEFWNTLLNGMFQEVVQIKDSQTLEAYKNTVDAVIISKRITAPNPQQMTSKKEIENSGVPRRVFMGRSA
ncbi:hypothetical protein N9359_07320, partial [Luminiphilus sp.]|nr:hypothetical protein [Luminiphilus sp.]